MKVEDFAAWLSAISGMSEDQRREAMVALEKASVVGGAAAASAKKEGGKRGRQEDAAQERLGVERVAAQGCPHCAGREIVGWGRSHGLLRFRCKSCGRTFNTLTRTPMAHLRKKDRWLDHARAMIEGKPGEDRGARAGDPSDDGVSLASPVSARPCKRQAPGLERDRRSGRNLRSRDPSRADGPTCREGAKARQERPGIPGLHQGQHSHPCRPRPEQRHLRRDLGQGRRRFG